MSDYDLWFICTYIGNNQFNYLMSLSAQISNLPNRVIATEIDVSFNLQLHLPALHMSYNFSSCCPLKLYYLESVKHSFGTHLVLIRMHCKTWPVNLLQCDNSVYVLGPKWLHFLVRQDYSLWSFTRDCRRQIIHCLVILLIWRSILMFVLFISFKSSV